MEENNDKLHRILGFKLLCRRYFVKLEDRWRHFQDLPLEQTVYHFGQDIYPTYIPLACEFLILRDYKPIYDFGKNKTKNGSRPASLGVFFVPEEYIPARPNIQSLDKRILNMSLKGEQVSHKTHQEYSEDRLKAIGDMTERECYDALRSFYEGAEEETVLVIQGLQMLNADQTVCKSKSREMDFIIVHYEKALIINIEVKKTLTDDAYSKVCKQLKENQAYLEDWFTCDISEEWRFVSMVYVNNLDKKLQYLQDNVFFSVGREDFLEKLMLIKISHFISKLMLVHEERTKERAKEKTLVPEHEFRLLAKYLLFCSPAVPLPIGGTFEKELSQAMDLQGKRENIMIWCFPTPQQKIAMQKSHVLFLSFFGTGKTLLMTAKAIDLALQEKNVLYLLFTNGKETLLTTNSLLYLNMEDHFKQYSRITLRQIFFKDGEGNKLKETTKKFDHIMIDEFFDDFAKLSERSQREFKRAVKGKQTVWMALSNTYNHRTAYDKDTNIANHVKKWFPYFHIVTMKIPLRSPRNIPMKMKEVLDERIDMDLNCLLLAQTELPPTLTQGKESKIKIKHTDPLSTILKSCFDAIANNSYGLVIVEDAAHTPLPRANNDCTRGWINDFIKFKKMFDSAFQELNLPPPLYWTEGNQSSKSEIIKWFYHRHNFLVTTYRMAMGFTSRVVINLGPLEAITRCSAILIQPESSINWHITTLPMVSHLAKTPLRTPLEAMGKLKFEFLTLL